jgi:hypothetical protein
MEGWKSVVADTTLEFSLSIADTDRDGQKKRGVLAP